ncbi:MAG: DNA topoisomerase I [Atopobium sp.]|uniref:DNA topoisomerase I n=1 Tax=Atopobium sp. TaxID=1872650 RepID=UPI002A750E7B|nr:DNA topoisomerase I [Atopobium sp.]MDY2788924.1 DNA topoisomerase I [Atopobium sp.]
MKLVVAEKNDAAQQIARLLCDTGKPKSDKVYNTPVYRFEHEGDEWVTIGLRGHILEPNFPPEMHYRKRGGWFGVTEEGEMLPCEVPQSLPTPPFESKRRPYLADGISIKSWNIASLPYLVWAPVEKLPAEKEIIRALKNLAKKADFVIIGTDFDREGELIGSDALTQIREVAPHVPVSRARYSAFTKREIDHAFSNLVELDQDLADAGDSRRYIDLIWGAVLTRYLTVAKRSGFGNTRSAGRVQTPTLALVVERERERMSFIPEDYWVINGIATSGDDEFKIAHANNRFTNGDDAQAAFTACNGVTPGTVVEVIKRERKSNPPAPFNTTSLQAAAAAEGISPARTMRLAESLYMDGLISYPRVDNTVYPSSLDLRGVVLALKSVPAYADACDSILSAPKLHPTRGKQETTDHPPIYPTAAANPDDLQPAEWKLYNLIARRFLATLMEPAVIEGTKFKITIANELFQASGDVLKVAGYRGVYPFGLKKDEQLPALEKGDEVSIKKVELAQKQTEPPARYSQGKLIQEMERLGLGTKSTRASMIERLYAVKYLKNDPVEPSQLGIAIIDALQTYAPHITSPQMTSQLEQDMTKVAEGGDTQSSVVSHSRALLAEMMEGLIEHTEDLGASISDAVTADARVGTCPQCGKDLVLKSSAKTRGSFIGCMGWPDCDVTFPVPSNVRIDALEGSAAVCPECGAPRIKCRPFRGKAFEVCVNPACPTNQEPDVVVGTCHVCAEQGRTGELIAHKSEKTGKRFIRCTNYEECGTSYPLPARGELHATSDRCPDCGAPMVEVQTARGPWKLCPNPECPSKEKSTRCSVKSTSKKTAAKKTTTKKTTSKKTKAQKTAAKKVSATTVKKSS